ncbi:MAG: fibronectin type III domain-containing protein [Oscillospiraceae bacterium]|jgi:hypothetical protein|nr:fibronectin type III domain-containing protein [Oscillospiraceae bacterium]
MGKKMLSAVLSLVFAVTAIPGVTGAAASPSGEWSATYNQAKTEATVTGYSGADDEITIPGFVGGEYTIVKGIAAATKFGANLKSVTIPASVKTIGGGAFRGYKKLSAIKVDDANTEYCSVDGVLFSKDKSKLIQYPEGKTAGSYSIPDGVTDINAGAFKDNAYLTSVAIPDGVSGVGEAAFYNCANLAAVTFKSKAPPKLSDNVFGKCPELKTVNIPKESKTAYTSVGQLKGLTLTETAKVSVSAPAKPTSVKAEANSKSKITVSWKKVSGANGYEIYRATSKDGKYTRVKRVTKGDTVKWSNKELKTNKKYYYKVRAYKTVDGKRVYGSFSAIKSARTKK